MNDKKIKFTFLRKDTCSKIILDVKLKYDKKDRPIFSVSGGLYDIIKKDYVYCGQCLDDLKEENFLHKADKELFNKIYYLWEKYHLNDTHAGTEEQEKALKDAGLSEFANDFDKCCDYLKSINKYEVTHPDSTNELKIIYRFGSGWVYYPIPKNDLLEIEFLFL